MRDVGGRLARGLAGVVIGALVAIPTVIFVDQLHLGNGSRDWTQLFTFCAVLAIVYKLVQLVLALPEPGARARVPRAVARTARR